MNWIETTARLLVQGIGIAVLLALALSGLVWSTAIFMQWWRAPNKRRLAIDETMACAEQLVQSYGGYTLTQDDRDGLCRAMEHYRKTAK